MQEIVLHLGLHKTGSTFLQRKLFDSKRRLAEAGSTPGGLLGDLLRQLGIGPELIDERPVPRANARLSMEAVLLVDALRRASPQGGEAVVRGDYPGELDDLPGVPFELPPDVLRRVAAATADDVAWIAETFRVHVRNEVSRRDPEPSLWGLETVASLGRLLGELHAERTAASEAPTPPRADPSS